MQQFSDQTDNDARTHTDPPGSTLSRTVQGYLYKMSSPVLLHSSRSKAVCVQNVICLLKSLFVPPLQTSCATLAEQQILFDNEDIRLFVAACAHSRRQTISIPRLLQMQSACIKIYKESWLPWRNNRLWQFLTVVHR